MTEDAGTIRITRANGEMSRVTTRSLNIHSPLLQALTQALGTRSTETDKVPPSLLFRPNGGKKNRERTHKRR